MIITDVPCSALGAVDTNPRTVASASPAEAEARPAPAVPQNIHVISPAPVQPSIVSTQMAGNGQIPSTAPPTAASSSPQKPSPSIWSSLLSGPGILLLILAVFGAAISKTKAEERKRRRRIVSLTDLEPGASNEAPSPTDDDEKELPYKPAPLMSVYELEFFQRLRSALPEYDIFPQVPLAAFVQIDRRKAGSQYFQNSYRWQNRIGQQRVDYLVCTRPNMAVLAAVELDDPSHDNNESTSRDRKKDKSLFDAGIRLVRWRVESMPDAEAIRAELFGSATA